MAQWPDPGVSFADLPLAGADTPLILRAYLSLPERWAAILWHTEVEQSTLADVAPLFGLSRNGVAALTRRAKEALRQAYLQMHISGIRRPECQPVAGQLGGFVRDALSWRETTLVAEHLEGCSDCRAVCAELSDLNAALRSQVAPAFLGAAAASYLSFADHEAAAGSPAAAEVAVTGQHAAELTGVLAAASGGTSGLISGRWVRQARRHQRWLAAGAAAVLAAIALGAYEISPAAKTASAGSPEHHQAQAAPPQRIRVVGEPSPHKSATPRAKPTHSAASVAATTSKPGVSSTLGATASHGASPAPSRGPSPNPGPTASPSPTADVKLAASVDVYGQGNTGVVVFSATDTGTAATAGLTATIVLPPGSSYVSDGHHWHHGHHGHHGQDGWTCQATASGATCQHQGISAGAETGGTIFIQVSGSSACGQPVQLTVTSGAQSASAQSPETIQCGGG